MLVLNPRRLASAREAIIGRSFPPIRSRVFRLKSYARYDIPQTHSFARSRVFGDVALVLFYLSPSFIEFTRGLPVYLS